MATIAEEPDWLMDGHVRVREGRVDFRAYECPFCFTRDRIDVQTGPEWLQLTFWCSHILTGEEAAIYATSAWGQP